MKKIIIRIICVITCIICLLVIFNNFSYAASGSEVVSKFNGKSGTSTSGGETIIKNIITPILSATRIIAAGVSIIMITYLGIHYMSAAPQEKASIKNQLITFTVGAVIVFGTVTILEKIKDFATGI